MNIPEGECSSCGRLLSKGGMSRHLKSCLGPGKRLLIGVAAPRSPYWLNIAAAPTARLQDLDQLLRDVWLECCGHLSAFEIDGRSYESSVYDHGMGEPAASMDARLSTVLGTAGTFKYMYDFGSTTHLAGRVQGTVGGAGSGASVLARNLAPPWACDRCGAPATTTCGSCGEATCGCADTCRECDESFEEMGLPIVNSPRTGVCGYVG